LAAAVHIARDASNQEMVMSSRGKKKTTMAKLTREARLRERRHEKAARKEARRDAAAHPPEREEPPTTDEQEGAYHPG
jgi:hypothetical protein